MFEQGERFPPWKRFLSGSLVLVMVAAVVAVLTAFSERKTITEELGINALPDVAGVLTGPSSGPQTILLIGSDERKQNKKYGYPSLSDTMMLVRLDPDLDVMPVLSMPRDLKIAIPGHGVDKMNAAYSYGGPKLVIKTIQEATGLKISHVVNVNFQGFRQAVDKIGCVYTDVDRRYFNNNVGLYAGQQFAAIDVKAGYQKLCGQKALDYVRFRHFDSDIYRAARQQSFLRQAKQQVGVTKLFSNAKGLKKIISKNTRTDRRLADGSTLQRLLVLGVKSAGKPVYQVEIPNIEYDNSKVSYVLASEKSLHKAADILIHGPKAKRKRAASNSTSTGNRKRKRSKKSSGALAPGLIPAKTEGRQQAVAAGFGIKLPVFYPTVRMSQGKYRTPRAYRLTTPDGNRVSAYRIVVELTNRVGDYYGVQGVNWGNPPILNGPHETRKIGRRTFQLYHEGNKLGMVAFQNGGRTFWVQNTLTRALTEKQMLGIAKSLRRRG